MFWTLVGNTVIIDVEWQNSYKFITLIFVISLAEILHDNANNVQFVVIIGIYALSARIFVPRFARAENARSRA